ncbi:MAG: copper amine oxidase N-terminal domain-containing protein [Defluviitaleaceae bacterium]|nr:copper amine oxidase N-terminal domain-containing protein [Defluviitaleaceae bacterium]
MKKIFACVFIFIFLSFTNFVFAEDKIEISFRVGDSTLFINGKPVTVEAPFIINGVTLVPVRVITEAFGAEVNWIAATREITLTYQSVEITLQIDNLNANVNGQRQTLLLAPQIANGSTMVPLRFISENFGADIGWDDTTKAVTVVKEIFSDSPVDIENILGRSNLPMMGDSYLKWSIRRTPGTEIELRSFDGLLNTFTLNENAYFEVDFFDNDDELSLDALQAIEMEMARQNTPMGQNTDKTKSGVEFVVTKFRDRSDFIERRVFARDEKILVVKITIDNSVGLNERNDLVAILDTFDFVFDAATTEDLSNVKDNMRLFENDELNIKFRLPADWRMISDDDRVNYFMFGTLLGDTVFAGASLEVYSKQGDDNANKWADEERKKDIGKYNTNFSTVDGLTNMQIGGTDARYFRKTQKIHTVETVSHRVFWELGDYMYCLYVTVRRGDENTIKNIFESVEFEKIIFDDMGILFRDSSDAVFIPVTNTTIGFSIDIPTTWSRLSNNSMFLDSAGTNVLVQRVADHPIDRAQAEESSKQMARNADAEIIRPLTTISSSNLSSSAQGGFIFETRRTTGDISVVSVIHLINMRNELFMIVASIPEYMNGATNRETLQRIVKSFANSN